MPRNRAENFSEPPPAIVMESNTFCNLTCLSCLTGQRKLPRPLGRMPYDSFKRLVDEVSPWVKVVHWSGMGEPLLFEDSLDYIKYLCEAGIHVRLDTNGHFFRSSDFAHRLVETGLSESNIAFDGIDQKSLSGARGPHADFQRLISGIRLLVEARDRLKSTLKINLQFIVSRPNEHLTHEALELGRSLRADSMTFKAIRLDPKDKRACRRLMPRSEQYREYVKESGGGWRLKGEMLNQCWAIHDYCVILWDGTLLPCCFDLDGTYAFGNVFATSFRDAWNSELAVSFRELASIHLPSIPLCEICPVGRDENNCWEFDLKEPGISAGTIKAANP